MANTVNNVTAGKPAVAGGVWRAPLGSTLPTDASTSLDAAFKCLGYVSEDGVKNNNSPESDTIKAWGGDSVLTVQTSKEDTWGLTMIEAINLELLKAIYGSTNVSGALATGVTVKANADEQADAIWVFEMILRGGVLKRVVLPDAKISEIGEITYKDDEAVGYELTLTAMPDSSGNTHYEYIKTAGT